MSFASYRGMETQKVIEISREKYNGLKRQGLAGSVKGQYYAVRGVGGIQETQLIPVKITGQINYKKRGRGSFSPVKIEGI